MNSEQIKKYADSLEGILRNAINDRVNYHARIANLDAEQTRMAKSIVFGIIKSMEASAALNCAAQELPIEVVYVSLIEAIEAWSRKIDKLSGAPDISRN